LKTTNITSKLYLNGLLNNAIMNRKLKCTLYTCMCTQHLAF